MKHISQSILAYLAGNQEPVMKINIMKIIQLHYYIYINQSNFEQKKKIIIIVLILFFY